MIRSGSSVRGLSLVTIARSAPFAAMADPLLGGRLALSLLDALVLAPQDAALYRDAVRRLGRSLAVRRATVTDTLHILEGEGLVRCTRARIIVRDRAGLERRAGKAYGAAEEAYRALQAPFGKAGDACDVPGVALRPAPPF